MIQDPQYSDLKANLYRNSNFEGASLPLGDNISKLGNKKFKEKGWSKDWNDILSSIKVEKGNIWDNRYLAEEENPSEIKYTVFKGKKNKYYSGMLIRQID